MPYPVLEVCRHIINYSQETGDGISNLKLQKILYLVQAWFLITCAAPCFREKIEAWGFGPVAYNEYKRYGRKNIPTVKYYIEWENNLSEARRVLFCDNTISKSDKVWIDGVVDHFSNYSATDLVKLTHGQDPWKNAYVPHQNREISLTSIREYFMDE